MSFRSMKEVLLRRFIEMAKGCRTTALRYAFPILAAIFFCVSAAQIHNANSRVIDQRHVEEGHTLVWRTPEADGGTGTVRAGEMNRLFRPSPTSTRLQ